MRRRFISPLWFFFVGVLALAPGIRAEPRVQHPILPPQDHGRRPYPFLLSVPRDYARAPATGWPLLVFLHGAGHSGENLWTLVTLGPPRLIEQGPDLSPADRLAAENITTAFVVVSP